jgi:hypothetical protein
LDGDGGVERRGEVEIEGAPRGGGEIERIGEGALGGAGGMHGEHFGTVEESGPDEETGAHAVEGGAADDGFQAVGEYEDDRPAALGPAAGDFDAGLGGGDGEFELFKKVGPPLAEPAGDGERAEATFEEETVFERFKILFEGAAGVVVADAGPGFGCVKMAAVEFEGGAALLHGDVVGVDAAEGDAGGEFFEFPAGAEAGVADGAVEVGEVEIFPHIDAEAGAQRGEQLGGERAVEAEGGGLGGEIGLGADGERGAEQEGGDLRGEPRERAGYQMSGDGLGGEAGGGERGGGEIEIARDELETTGAERAADDGADLAGRRRRRAGRRNRR